MDQRALNDLHIQNPKVGDYWHEMFAPVCVVCAVDDDTVTVCRTTVEVDSDNWTWDLTKKERLSREEFAKSLAYESIAGYWADVIPKRMQWVADFAEA